MTTSLVLGEEDVLDNLLRTMKLPGKLTTMPEPDSQYTRVTYIPDEKACEGWTLEGLRKQSLIHETKFSYRDILDEEGPGGQEVGLSRLIARWLMGEVSKGPTEELTNDAFSRAFSTRRQDG